MVGVKWAGRCVARGFRAVGHAVWANWQFQGYIMAMGYLPQDETQGLENPEIKEFQRNHS